jgi:hypothetical protein
MKKLLIHLIIIAAVAGFPPVYGQNLLINGNFENPATNPGNGASFLSGWNEVWNFGTAGQNLVNADGATRQNWGTEVAAPFAGAVSAKNFFDGGIYQEVSITGGQQYVFSGATFVPSGGSSQLDQWGVFTTVEWRLLDGTVLDQFIGLRHDDEPRNQWNAFSDTLTAPLGAQVARIQIGTYSSNPAPGPGQILPANPTRFDDISFAQIPEPQSVALLAAGLGMLAAVGRKRRF